MINDILLYLTRNAGTLLIAAGGCVLAYILHRDAKLQDKIKSWVESLEAAVKARLSLAEDACDWLAELTSRSAQSVKLELRNRSENRSGFRPKMSKFDN